MLQPNELRIGNIVQDTKSKTPLLVVGIADKNISTYVIDRGMFPLDKGWQIEPIPLTPEILEKCGFIRGKEIGDRNVFYSTGAHLIHLEITTTGGWLLQGNIIKGSHHLQHLHQLQNLYFALTGTELNYKP